MMENGFYQMNSEVLRFKVGKDKDKDKEKIMFNQYLMRKENLQRISANLPRGQFNITVRTTAMDLNITHAKAQRLLKEFVRIKVIELIRAGGKDRTPSIYSYITAKGNTVADTVIDTENDTENDTVKSINITLLDGTNDNVTDTLNEYVSDTSKKENLKRELKKNLNNEEEEGKQNYDLISLCKAFKDAKGDLSQAAQIELRKLLKLYSRNLIIKAIEEMVLRADKPNLKYLINTLKDWKSRGLISIQDASEGIAEHELNNFKAREILQKKKIKSIKNENFNKNHTNNYKKTQKRSFNDYEQRSYDFDELEKKLLGWS
jgi:DnaD/phage-associated family protein